MLSAAKPQGRPLQSGADDLGVPTAGPPRLPLKTGWPFWRPRLRATLHGDSHLLSSCRDTGPPLPPGLEPVHAVEHARGRGPRGGWGRGRCAKSSGSAGVARSARGSHGRGGGGTSRWLDHWRPPLERSDGTAGGGRRLSGASASLREDRRRVSKALMSFFARAFPFFPRSRARGKLCHRTICCSQRQGGAACLLLLPDCYVGLGADGTCRPTEQARTS